MAARLKIDTDMKNINDEYPVSCLPTKLNNRTGKARNCPFEAIDLNLYDDNAHISHYTRENSTMDINTEHFLL